MIRKPQDYRCEVRPAMRGGVGEVHIAHYYDEKNELLAPTRLCARLTLAPGASIGFHRHEREEEIFIVLKGRAEVDDNGHPGIAEVGDTILTGNGAGHAIQSLGPDPLELLALIVAYPEQPQS